MSDSNVPPGTEMGLGDCVKAEFVWAAKSNSWDDQACLEPLFAGAMAGCTR